MLIYMWLSDYHYLVYCHPYILLCIYTSFWQRFCGRPHTTWVHNICSDINTSALDILHQAQDR